MTFGNSERRDMDADALAELLATEARDLRPAGSVGLYELIWISNGLDPRPSRSEAIIAAERAVRRLLTEGASLALFVWPEHAPQSFVVEPRVIPETAWMDPERGHPYLGLIWPSDT